MQDADISKVHMLVATMVSCALFMVAIDSKQPNTDLQLASAIGGTFVGVVGGLIAYAICFAFKKPYKRISYIVGLLLVTLVSIAGQNGVKLFGPENFEQCMMSNMKDMPTNMTAVVARECRRQFPSKTNQP